MKAEDEIGQIGAVARARRVRLPAGSHRLNSTDRAALRQLRLQEMDLNIEVRRLQVERIQSRRVLEAHYAQIFNELGGRFWPVREKMSRLLHPEWAEEQDRLAAERARLGNDLADRLARLRARRCNAIREVARANRQIEQTQQGTIHTSNPERTIRKFVAHRDLFEAQILELDRQINEITARV